MYWIHKLCTHKKVTKQKKKTYVLKAQIHPPLYTQKSIGHTKHYTHKTGIRYTKHSHYTHKKGIRHTKPLPQWPRKHLGYWVIRVGLMDILPYRQLAGTINKQSSICVYWSQPGGGVNLGIALGLIRRQLYTQRADRQFSEGSFIRWSIGTFWNMAPPDLLHDSSLTGKYNVKYVSFKVQRNYHCLTSPL